MNRILKFRAWDKAKKEWITDWQDTIYPESYGFDGGNLFDVMQFTGLHDKNGLEIYEGDVVGYTDEPNYTVEWASAHSGYQWCLVDAKGERSDYYGGIDAEYVEVIGNRFEHPDLLEKSE
jgi:uncharacterized phage protein (TIGR01671 family)